MKNLQLLIIFLISISFLILWLNIKNLFSINLYKLKFLKTLPPFLSFVCFTTKPLGSSTSLLGVARRGEKGKTPPPVRSASQRRAVRLEGQLRLPLLNPCYATEGATPCHATEGWAGGPDSISLLRKCKLLLNKSKLLVYIKYLQRIILYLFLMYKLIKIFPIVYTVSILLLQSFLNFLLLLLLFLEFSISLSMWPTISKGKEFFFNLYFSFFLEFALLNLSFVFSNVNVKLKYLYLIFNKNSFNLSRFVNYFTSIISRIRNIVKISSLYLFFSDILIYIFPSLGVFALFIEVEVNIFSFKFPKYNFNCSFAGTDLSNSSDSSLSTDSSRSPSLQTGEGVLSCPSTPAGLDRSSTLTTLGKDGGVEGATPPLPNLQFKEGLDSNTTEGSSNYITNINNFNFNNFSLNEKHEYLKIKFYNKALDPNTAYLDWFTQILFKTDGTQNNIDECIEKNLQAIQKIERDSKLNSHSFTRIRPFLIHRTDNSKIKIPDTIPYKDSSNLE